MDVFEIDLISKLNVFAVLEDKEVEVAFIPRRCDRSCVGTRQQQIEHLTSSGNGGSYACKQEASLMLRWHFVPKFRITKGLRTSLLIRVKLIFVSVWVEDRSLFSFPRYVQLYVQHICMCTACYFIESLKFMWEEGMEINCGAKGVSCGLTIWLPEMTTRSRRPLSQLD